MVQTDNFSKEEVEYFEWKDGLPEPDEVETERDAAEDSVPFDAFDNSSCYIFGFKNRDDSGLSAEAIVQRWPLLRFSMSGRAARATSIGATVLMLIVRTISSGN
jgi:hypothetical protein